MDNNIMVSIICTTYNHENYIEKCIDGFLEQVVNFKYEILIHDDASTDKTADIIKRYERKYPDRFKCIYQTDNQYSKGVKIGKILFEKSVGKYIAWCEGDDFWCDKNKLQMQVDYMEKNKDCSLCVHAGYLAYEDGILKKQMFKPFVQNKIISHEEILEKWLFPTASILYRKSCRMQYDLGYGKNIPCGDFPLAVYLSNKGHVYYMNRSMCVYRTFSKSSLSRELKNDSIKRKKRTFEFIQLLNKIDEKENYEYHDIIEKHILKVEFDQLVADYDYKTIKKDKYLTCYNNLKLHVKIILCLGFYFPNIIPRLIEQYKDIKERIIYIKCCRESNLDS